MAKQKKLFDLEGKVAIVTGGITGIGFSISTALGEHGAKLVIAVKDRVDRESRRKAQALQKKGIDAILLPVDIREEESCLEMAKSAAKEYGRVDILINCAGMAFPKLPELTTVEEFKNVLDTNLVGAFSCAKAVYPYMKKAGGGKIVNIASLASIMAAPTMTAYAPSKAGMIQLSRVLAGAWGKDNIQVNSILPGYTETEMTKGYQENREFVKRVTDRTPLGRWGKPDDFKGAAVFLSSSASDFVTGSSLVIDGGYSFFA